MSPITSSQLNFKSQLIDYFELTKPRVVLLMLLTAWIGMFMAQEPSHLNWTLMAVATMGIAMAAGSAAIINQLVEIQIDQKMSRTKYRPLAKGRISVSRALIFSIVIGFLGIWMLAVWVNPLTAWLTLGTQLGYAFIYTLYLKHATPQNIVIGGLFGATPPLLGWSAITNTIDPNSLLLVLIIFAWTPPHFWALAIYRQKEYAKASVPMLPVTHGIQFTKLNVVLYSVLLLAISVFPFITHLCGGIYLVSSILLGLIFIGYSIKLYFSQNDKVALHTFGYSIVYLIALFIALFVDKLFFYYYF